jgi:hypothetical protein
MLKYLPYAIQALFVVGGLSLGLWLKTGALPGAPAAASHEAEEAHPAEAHAKAADAKKPEKKPAKDAHGDKKKKKGGHGESSEAADSPYGYLKFSRQFVVPIVGSAGVTSLVVMDINIEMPPDATEGAYTLEPKLRDSILGALLDLSHKGAFGENFLDQGNLDNVRGELLAAARAIIGDEARNVMILSIARQDV